MQIDPTKFVQLKLQCARDAGPTLQPLFEAVMRSMAIENPEELRKYREATLKAGQAVLEKATVKQLLAGSQGTGFFRIQAQGKDVGYMKITQGPGKQVNQPGVEVKIGSRMVVGDRIFDTESRFFMGDDGKSEAWTITTSLKARPGSAKPIRPATWEETGVRFKQDITLVRQQPSGLEGFVGPGDQGTAPELDDQGRLGNPQDFRRDVKQPRTVAPETVAYKTPPLAYLSQAQVHMIQHLLPHDKAAEYGFYAYHPGTGKLTLRTERVVPAADGSYAIYSKPSQDQVETYAKYSAQGTLLEKNLGEGRMLTPTNEATLQALWKE